MIKCSYFDKIFGNKCSRIMLLPTFFSYSMTLDGDLEVKYLEVGTLYLGSKVQKDSVKGWIALTLLRMSTVFKYDYQNGNWNLRVSDMSVSKT